MFPRIGAVCLRICAMSFVKSSGSTWRPLTFPRKDGILSFVVRSSDILVRRSSALVLAFVAPSSNSPLITRLIGGGDTSSPTPRLSSSLPTDLGIVPFEDRVKQILKALSYFLCNLFHLLFGKTQYFFRQHSPLLDTVITGYNVNMGMWNKPMSKILYPLRIHCFL